MLKRGLAIFVLSIFLLHFVGFYLYFIVQLKHIRTEMRSSLNRTGTENLEIITLSGAVYGKSKVNEHEIVIAGKMYDVARIEKENGLVKVYCLADHAEDDLLSFFHRIIKMPFKERKVPQQLLTYTTLSFIVPSVLNPTDSESTVIQGRTKYAEYMPPYFPVQDSPPPRA